MIRIVKVTRVITYTGPEELVKVASKSLSIAPDGWEGVKVKESIVGIPQLIGYTGDITKQNKSPEGAEG